MYSEETTEVVLIEDNPYDAELALRAFNSNFLSQDVHWIRDGQEAIAYLFEETNEVKHRQLKLILLDLKIPKVSGYEILIKLKTDPNTSAIPVVVFSSSAELKDIKKCNEAGANSFLVKPVGFERFLDTIKEIGTYWLVHNRI